MSDALKSNRRNGCDGEPAGVGFSDRKGTSPSSEKEQPTSAGEVSVLVADPPWSFSDALPGKKRGASKHYACMSVDDICAMAESLPTASDVRSVLFLWRVGAMPEESYKVARAWGYVPKAELVWEKTTATGKDHFGMGHYVRWSHETCVIAVRGAGCTSRDKSVRSRFKAPVGEHSEKPDAFYDLVRRMYPHARRYEMFARKIRPDFIQFGDELGKLGQEASP